MKPPPEHGTEARYQAAKHAGRRATLEDYDAHAARVRAWYAANVEHARRLSRERGRRFRERQAAERQDRVDAWVRSITSPTEA